MFLWKATSNLKPASLLTSILVFLLPWSALPCTIFSSHMGLVPFAGKIRDTLDHHEQALKIIPPDTSNGELWAYMGLFAVNGPESITLSPLKMGVNEHGVFIGFATPSSIPSEARRSSPFFKDLTHYILTRAKSVGEARSLLGQIETPLGARIMIISDAQESVLLENGLEGSFQVKSTGDFATNHFQLRKYRYLNVSGMEDSQMRYDLASYLVPLLTFTSPEDAEKILDRMWVKRTTQKSTFTRSDFVVYYPAGQTPFVKVRMENNGLVESSQISLESLFQKSPPLSCSSVLVQRVSQSF